MMVMCEPTKEITADYENNENNVNNVCVPNTSKMDCSYIRKTYEKFKLLKQLWRQQIMAIFQPTEETNDVNDVNNVNAPTTSEVNFTHIRMRSGILKLLQQICIIVIATIACFWFLREPTLDFCLQNSDCEKNYYYYICVGNIVILLFTSVLLLIWLPVIHVFMWLFILRKAEQSTNYKWYTIEYTISILGATMCSIASAFLFIGSYIVSSMFTMILTVLFLFDIGLVRHKQKINLPFQSEQFVI